MVKLLEPGDRLENWLVLERFVGSYGVVYVLREMDHDEELARPAKVIAKTLRPEWSTDPECVAQFERECYAWLSLGSYKHIVRLYTVDRFSALPYALGEYVPRVLLPNTLRGWIDAQIIELETAFRFGIQICRALAYSRDCGVLVHQDLKPENVMITPSGFVKVTDWGLSHMAWLTPAESETRSQVPYTPAKPSTRPTHSRYGTSGYAAPELHQSATAPNPQSDLFSLGVILVEMLCGQRPAADTLPSGLQQSLATWLPANHQTLIEMLAACLNSRPDQRPASAQVIEEVLSQSFAEITGVPIEAPPLRERDQFSDLGQRAYALFMLGRVDEAIRLQRQAMNRAGETAKSQADAPLAVLMDYKEKGWKPIFSPETVRTVEDKLRQSPDDVDNLDHAILLYAEMGNYARALELCQAWMQRQSHQALPYKRAAYVMRKQGCLTEALTLLDRALALTPKDVDAWLEMADVYEAQGDWAKAVAVARQAVAADPRHTQAHVSLGHCLNRIGDFHAAYDAFSQAVTLDPKNAVAWYDLGTVSLKIGRADQAITFFQKAVEIDPHFAQAFNSLASVYMQLGVAQEAMVALEKAIEADPHYARPWFNKGKLYEYLKKYDLARESFQKALAIDPNYALARQALSDLETQHRL